MTKQQYFKLGQSREGHVHAALTYWGSGLCAQPLVEVDDRHHFTAAQLGDHVSCLDCLHLAGGSDHLLASQRSAS